MTYRVAIDTGGTFTDIVAVEEGTGRIGVTKIPSTPRDPSLALVKGVEKVARTVGFDPGDIDVVAHGTTTATNAILQKQFQRIGLLVTRGFRHVLEIARQSVPDGYGNSYFWVKPPRIVPLERVREVGRANGLRRSRAQSARRGGRRALPARRSAARGRLHRHLLPPQLRQRRARAARREILRAHMPDAFVSLSCEVLPEYREYERAMTDDPRRIRQALYARLRAPGRSRLCTGWSEGPCRS